MLRARVPRLIDGRRYNAGDPIDPSGWPDGLVGTLLRQRIIEDVADTTVLEEPGLNEMRKPALLQVAEAHGLDIPDKVTVAELREMLKEVTDG
jgi:hypothetical protein